MRKKRRSRERRGEGEREREMYKQVSLLSFDGFEFLQDILWDFWFGDTNGNDGDARVILVTRILRGERERERELMGKIVGV